MDSETLALPTYDLTSFSFRNTDLLDFRNTDLLDSRYPLFGTSLHWHP